MTRCSRRRARPRARPTRARTELIAIQQRIVARLNAEIRKSIGPPPAALRLYQQEYDRDFARFERVSSKRELVASCRAADIVYCGDYHTLRQSQATALKLIEELVRSGREVTLALEMVASHHQDILDRYLVGLIDEQEFLWLVDYHNTWDFHWLPYRSLLELCRREGLRVIAINSDPEECSSRVVERDMHAAHLIVKEALERPSNLIFVLDGDLHVARDHLPLSVDRLLASRRERRRKVIVHQNADPVYWRLARAGLEREADVVRISSDCYCVLSATPLVKLQSYLNWEQNHAELCGFVHPAWRTDDPMAADFTEQMHELVAAIAGFLDIGEDGLDRFSIYTTGDLDFLASLSRDRRFNPREVAEIKRQVRANESYFIPRANIIYLADLSAHRAAEEAAHFINTVCAGFDGERRDPCDGFYYRAVKEAIGFFGSRIIDHKRCCMSFEDFRGFIAARRARRLGREEHMIRTIGRQVLLHRQAEERWLRLGRLSGVGSLYLQPAEVADGAAHALGYIIGDKLYNALVSGVVTKRYVRELFYDTLAPGASQARYLSLVKLLEGIDHGVPCESERFSSAV